MSEKDESRKMQLLRSVLDPVFKTQRIEGLPSGVTIHAIERTQSFGARHSLAGEVLVELADGSIHRLTGNELSEWNDVLAPFLRSWRLTED